MLPSIVQPTLLLDRAKCIKNIEQIIAKVKRSDVKFRPHFKTHQSHEIGNWFGERGINSCTVSSLRMAEYFAKDHWIDITVAFPVNLLEIERINALASQIKLNLLVSSAGVVIELLQKLENHVGIFIEIDTGYHRTGVQPYDHQRLDQIIAEIRSSSLLKFVGFLSHGGQTYNCRKTEDVISIHQLEVRLMDELRKRYEPIYPELICSLGDTPSASIVDDLSGADEIRSGNLVFYDLTQVQIGSCQLDQIAIALACPIVAVYPERNEIVIYGGGVHFSKDFLPLDDGGRSFGSVVNLNNSGWELPPTTMYVKSISQEHGVVHASNEVINNYKVGDVIGILPVHSCLMADAMGSYTTTTGEHISMMS